MIEPLVLEGVFRELCRCGMALSVRDYLDAVSAVARGFGCADKTALIRICQALWARSSDEGRLVRVVIERAAQPSEWERPHISSALAAMASENRAEVVPSSPRAATESPAESSTRVRLQFAPSRDGGLPLPRAALHGSLEDAFVLDERPLVSERAMAVAWRRLYRPARHGPPIEFDIEATARAQSVSYGVVQPVFVPARSNRARVVLAIDVSASMVAWQSFGSSLERSLAQGRMAQVSVFYFENVPDVLFRRRTLDESCSLPDGERSALLVLSDAGAARGYRRPERARRTREFFAGTASRLQPMVWLNPLPRGRWRGTTAELIAKVPGLASFCANPVEFTRAIDALRGH